MMAMKFMTALIAQQCRLDLGELERGVLDERDFFFDDIEAELHVVAAMAGQGVETDFDRFHAFGLLLNRFFFNGFQNGADEMNFVHK
jgi:hypothetical protein